MTLTSLTCNQAANKSSLVLHPNDNRSGISQVTEEERGEVHFDIQEVKKVRQGWNAGDKKMWSGLKHKHRSPEGQRERHFGVLKQDLCPGDGDNEQHILLKPRALTVLETGIVRRVEVGAVAAHSCRTC